MRPVAGQDVLEHLVAQIVDAGLQRRLQQAQGGLSREEGRIGTIDDSGIRTAIGRRPVVGRALLRAGQLGLRLPVLLVGQRRVLTVVEPLEVVAEEVRVEDVSHPVHCGR
jgi:hypothetical protein